MKLLEPCFKGLNNRTGVANTNSIRICHLDKGEMTKRLNFIHKM